MDLTTLIQDVLILVEKDLQRYRIRLETRIEGRPEAEVNSGQIQQVLLNLIVNARQAMPNGGTLTVGLKTSSDNSVAEISVKDTGTGIPAEKLQRIFEPFFTTKVADERGQGGTGLGLSLARDVMETHGGRIRVESAVGVGTTFTLKLPLANAKPVQRTTTTTAKPAAAR
jgi:signal transduction histidine kinase